MCPKETLFFKTISYALMRDLTCAPKKNPSGIGLSIIFCNGHNRFNLLPNKLNRLCPLRNIIESPMSLGFSHSAKLCNIQKTQPRDKSQNIVITSIMIKNVFIIQIFFQSVRFSSLRFIFFIFFSLLTMR
jgi:hypothetical protein